MNLIASRSRLISADSSVVWEVISDIENAERYISAIKKIEVLEPRQGGSILGFKWKETREWMGRDAVELMWVTATDDESFYETRAESHGSVYTSRMELSNTAAGTELSMLFYCEPLSLGAKIMWLMTGWMAKKSLGKMIDQDLGDIRQAVEKR